MTDTTTKADKGRPTDYSDNKADEICELIAEGNSLVKICKREDMPGRSTAMRWLLNHPYFRDRYALARELQADYLFEELLDIADDTFNDAIEDKNGNVRTNWEVVNRSRLRIDTRKWIISKLAPKKYGDRADEVKEENNWTVNGIPTKTNQRAD